MAPECHCLAVSIPGPEGVLEGNLWYTDEEPGQEGVLLCPPHPLLAGNMENNVVQAVATHCAGLGLPVLLFNYRGVGKSFKPDPDLPLFEYWHRLDQEDTFSSVFSDTRAVLAFCRRYFQRVHLVGYSFGAFIALNLLAEKAEGPSSYTAIAPPLEERDFTHLSTLSLPGLLITAAEDLLLKERADLTLPPTFQRIILEDTDHFFLGREEEVAQAVGEFITGLSLP
ncbi:MAG: alpha/beta fold hydrolase [Deltaproteobacteria bacterium]|nr:alpha/beta fold hydrolase [Deltaproteobacteria bacterium]